MKKCLIILLIIVVLLVLTSCSDNLDYEYPRVRIDPSSAGTYITFSLNEPSWIFDGYVIDKEERTVTMQFKDKRP